MSTTPELDPHVIDLGELFDVLRRRKGTVAVVTLLFTGLALALVYFRAPSYAAEAEVSVQPLSASAALQGLSTDLNMNTESRVVSSSDAVLSAAASDSALGLDPQSQEDLDALSAKLSVSVPASTTLLDITCTDGSAEIARACADAVANAYISDRVSGAQTAYDDAKKTPLSQIEATTQQIRKMTALLAQAPKAQQARIQNQIDSSNNLLLVEQTELSNIPAPNPTAARLALPARVPSAPSNKDYVSTGILAGILGFVLGVGLAFVIDRMDDRVTGQDRMEEALGASVLAAVPKISSRRKKEESNIVTLSSPDSAPAEAYKSARIALLYMAREEGLHVVAVTAPGSGEGKTTTTVNLSVALAQTGRRVVAVSCDLRNPRLHRFFKLGNEIGLSSVLQGSATVEAATQRTGLHDLEVIASGPTPDNPAELLGSGAMERVLDYLRSRFDMVLLDTPPALVFSDAVAIAQLADGVVVVADASKTRRAAIIDLRQRLDRVRGQVVAGILNNLDPKHGKRYSSYYRSQNGSDDAYSKHPPANGRQGVSAAGATSSTPK